MNDHTATRRALLAGLAGLAAFPEMVRAQAGPASGARVAADAQHRRCRRQLAAEPALDRGISPRQPDLCRKVQLHPGAGARAAGQAAGAAGGGAGGHRHGDDRDGWRRRRHQPEPLGEAAARPFGLVAEPGEDIAAGGAADAGVGAGPGGVRLVLPGRAVARIHAGQGAAAAALGRGVAGLDEGSSQAVHVCAAGQLRPWARLFDGVAVPARRRRSEGPGEGLGQDLELPFRTRPQRRVLSDRHRCDDEGTGRGVARHHRHDDRLGHQSAGARRGAEGGRDHRAEQFPTG